MAESKLAKAVAAQNALVAPRIVPLDTLLVRVLVAGTYNGTGHKALPATQVGDVIAVAHGWYAAELIRAGLVELYTEPEPEPAEDAEPEPAKPARKRKGH